MIVLFIEDLGKIASTPQVLEALVTALKDADADSSVRYYAAKILVEWEKAGMRFFVSHTAEVNSRWRISTIWEKTKRSIFAFHAPKANARWRMHTVAQLNMAL